MVGSEGTDAGTAEAGNGGICCWRKARMGTLAPRRLLLEKGTDGDASSKASAAGIDCPSALRDIAGHRHQC